MALGKVGSLTRLHNTAIMIVKEKGTLKMIVSKSKAMRIGKDHGAIGLHVAKNK